MKLKRIWTYRTPLFALILLCSSIVSLVIYIALADTLKARITDLERDLGVAERAVNNAEGKLGAAHDLMDKLHTDWSALSAANRDKAVDAIISLLSLDWAALVKQGAKIGITFDGKSSLTSNFDSAVSRVEMLILEMNTAQIRYYTTLGKVQKLIREHNAGHADRGQTPWERHTVPSGPVEPWFVDDDLPDIACKGGCGVTFSSPSASTGDHKTKCGDGENVDDEARRRQHENGLWGLNHEARVNLILSERSATKGCGRDYYWCTQSEEHKIRFCNKQVSNGGTSQRCGQGYRNCMPLSTEHNGDSYKTSHDENGSVSSGQGSTGSQYVAPEPTPVSTDGTPNCMDCTSDCSSPCSCTNSGTCGGTPTDGTPNCMDCTSDCSSPCSCTNSGTCGGSPSTPSTPDNDDDDSGGSTMVWCSFCNKSVDSSDSDYTYSHVKTYSCLHDGCDVTFTMCSYHLIPCNSPNNEYHRY